MRDEIKIKRLHSGEQEGGKNLNHIRGRGLMKNMVREKGNIVS
jgi:hypothetical protein